MHAVQVFDSQINMFNLRSFFVPYRNKPLLDSVTVESQFVSFIIVFVPPSFTLRDREPNRMDNRKNKKRLAIL